MTDHTHADPPDARTEADPTRAEEAIQATADETSSPLDDLSGAVAQSDPPSGDVDSAPAELIRAERVEVRQGSVNQVQATDVRVYQSGMARVEAHEVSVVQGGIGLARADEIRLEHQSGALAAVARKVEVGPESNVMLLLAREVSGSVRPMLDWRSAFALGAGIVVARAILSRLGRR